MSRTAGFTILTTLLEFGETRAGSHFTDLRFCRFIRNLFPQIMMDHRFIIPILPVHSECGRSPRVYWRHDFRLKMSLTEEMAMELAIINPVTEQAFQGNPAAVCLLDGEKDGGWMQKVAKEIHMPVTAFIRRHKHEIPPPLVYPCGRNPDLRTWNAGEFVFSVGERACGKRETDWLPYKERRPSIRACGWLGPIGVSIHAPRANARP
ncbi:hypothetical protein B4135_3611 [Caldibacillus debilis]|uniref:Uncharacterized protein n=1 Tax=Caldibacillus debilis TaxID=301148 RepID=A0A150LEG5_9BACI|nr:hypothetical protein B4135_3611 [Caldibacillus debilis]